MKLMKLSDRMHEIREALEKVAANPLRHADKIAALSTAQADVLATLAADYDQRHAAPRAKRTAAKR